MKRFLSFGLAGLLATTAPAIAQDTIILIDRDALARILQGERMEDALGGQFGRGPATVRDREEMRERMRERMSDRGEMEAMDGRRSMREDDDDDRMSRYGDRDQWWGNERHAGRQRRHHDFYDMREMYDADQDGRITQEEVTAARESRLAAFDENGDDALSLAEYERLWLDAMRERMVRRFQSHDRDGDGLVTKEEFNRPTRGFVAWRDRNRDGVIDAYDYDMPQHGRAPGFRNGQQGEPGDVGGMGQGGRQTGAEQNRQAQQGNQSRQQRGQTQQGLQGIPDADVEVQKQDGSAN